MQELMVMIAGFLGRRYSERDKTRFLRYLSARLGESVRPFALDTRPRPGPGGKSCRNLIAGKLKEAAVVLAAPYDTGTRMLLPGAAYAPTDPRRNYRTDSLNLALAAILGLGIFFLYFFLVLRPFFPGGTVPVQVLTGVGMAACAAAGFRLMSGWPNRRNYNRNSSCVVLLLQGWLQDVWGERTALAFLDRSCCSVEGGSRLGEQMREERSKALVVLLDSICLGDTLFVCYRVKTEAQARRTAQILGESFPVRLVPLDEERAGQTVLSCFSRALLLTGGREENGTCVIRDTRCGADSEIDLEKMKRLLEKLTQVAESLQQGPLH